jgi:hypothetical protein
MTAFIKMASNSFQVLNVLFAAFLFSFKCCLTNTHVLLHNAQTVLKETAPMDCPVMLVQECGKTVEGVIPSVEVSKAIDDLYISRAAMSRLCTVCPTTVDGGMMRCGRCKRAYYCGITCQKADWPRHKLFCVRFGGKVDGVSVS